MVYSNPASEQIEINITEENTPIDFIEIFDRSGRIVESQSFDHSAKILMNVAHFSTGVYIVRVNGKYLKRVSVFR